MALPAQYARLAIHWQNDGRDDVNVLWYRCTGVASIPYDPAAAALAFDGYFRTVYIGVLSITANFTGVDLSVNLSGVTYSGSWGNISAGTITGDCEPAEVAVILHKTTAQPGRSGRGRTFVGAVPESNTLQSRVAAAAVASYGNISTAIMAVRVNQGLTFTPALKSHKLIAMFDLVAVTMDQVLGHIKHRRPRR
jgi:hypothetical protein